MGSQALRKCTPSGCYGALWAEQAEEKLGAGASWRNPDLVFPNTKGGVNRRATL